MIREFTLYNSNNETWYLTDKDIKSFLCDPAGLGLQRQLNVSRYGNIQRINGITENFPVASGDILFYDAENDDRYERYNQFVRFISHDPLTLVYTVPGVNSFYLDCVVSSLQKTETKQDHILTCPITFQGLSLWKGTEQTVTGTSNTYELNNQGDFPCGFEITIEGSLTNPYILLSQDDELYGEAKFDDTTAFNSLYLNSNDGEQNVILQQGGSVLPNPLSYQDLSISNGSIYVTFVKLARGISELEIGMESGSITSVEIKYQPIYRSV